MMNGMRNGIGVLLSVGGGVKMKAYWKDDKPFGKVIGENYGIYIFIMDF